MFFLRFAPAAAVVVMLAFRVSHFSLRKSSLRSTSRRTRHSTGRPAMKLRVACEFMRSASCQRKGQPDRYRLEERPIKGHAPIRHISKDPLV